MEKISFISEDGITEEFFVEEETKIRGVSYLLVSDSEDEEANAYIMKDISAADESDACYVMVEDEEELQAVFKVFEQMLEDVDFEV